MSVLRQGTDGPVSNGDRRRRARARPLRVVLALAVALTGCSIPFGPGGEPSSHQSPQETRRERNRIYMQEQEQLERSRTFDRSGPPSDR
jgi:hypothetical protein